MQKKSNILLDLRYIFGLSKYTDLSRHLKMTNLKAIERWNRLGIPDYIEPLLVFIYRQAETIKKLEEEIKELKK